MSEKIRLGFIGVANMGTLNIKEFFKHDELARVAAVCDVDEGHLAKTRDLVNEHYGDEACAAYSDFRELNRCDAIDAVVVTTPDHWHACMAIDAARCGKDVYLEKPLALTIVEGRRICEVMKETGRILQTGSQQRSMPKFRQCCELVRNGYLGDLQRIEIELPPNNKTCEPQWSPMPVPEGFDYDFWLGPAPEAEYHEQRCHYQFRFLLDYSGGQVTNFGAHHLDIAHWAMGMDDSGPRKISGCGEWPTSGLFTTTTKVDFRFEYDNGVELVCKTGESKLRFIGAAGAMTVARGKLESDPAEIAETEWKDGDIRLYQSDNHHANWLECIRTREQPVCPPEVGHRSATACHLANIAMKLGRELEWDPASEAFVNDDEANAMRSRPYRPPWSLD